MAMVSAQHKSTFQKKKKNNPKQTYLPLLFNVYRTTEKKYLSSIFLLD